jgi:membrane protease YdiL (CAAX protease family)
VSSGGRLAVVLACAFVFLWGGTTVAGWTSGIPLGGAALQSCGITAAGFALAGVLIAAVFWAARGRR